MDQDYVVACSESELWPGDIFPDVPFPLLRYPLHTYRPDSKAKKSGTIQVFASDGENKPGDIAHCAYQLSTVMLLSHGCEIDKAVKPSAAHKQHLLVAALERITDTMSPELRDRIRSGQQPNRLYLPPSQILLEEYCVDLRRIVPIPAQMLLDFQHLRLGSLQEDAKLDLAAQLGVYFSGLALYVQDVNCPHCGKAINPQAFMLESSQVDNPSPPLPEVSSRELA